MKTRTTLATTLFALASFPLMAQQPPPPGQPNTPATQQNSPESASPNSSAASQEAPAAASQAPAIEMSPVTGELVSKLDSKTAKTGDSVVVQTKASIKTADGTEIPKGSKLVGHVLAAKASAAGDNSQVALQFDHFELKGGQNLPVHSQIQSITPAGGAASTSGPGANPSTSGTNGGSRASGAQQGTGADSAAAAGNGPPAAGTVVAKTGNIAIATTSVPGVLLANNAPGQQDPRMAQASSILLGAKQDIQLDGGTQMVLGVAAAGGNAVIGIQSRQWAFLPLP